VSCGRALPLNFGELASLTGGSFSPQSSVTRAPGERSYPLVADEYLDLNSRVAYHFTLVDACPSDTPSNN